MPFACSTRRLYRGGILIWFTTLPIVFSALAGAWASLSGSRVHNAGTIETTPQPDMTLPSGINSAIVIKPDEKTYAESLDLA